MNPVGDHLGGVNIDHGRDGLFNGVCIGDRSVGLVFGGLFGLYQYRFFHGFAHGNDLGRATHQFRLDQQDVQEGSSQAGHNGLHYKGK